MKKTAVRQVTALGERGTGDIVNLECDIIGKYVEKLMVPVKEEKQPESRITEEFLRKYGF